jgi:riboflavin kinase/FMN adenylyltransferase
MERRIVGQPVPAHLRGGVLALGNFDGFHVGHQTLVAHTLARAKTEGRPAMVATFDPHPARFFRPETPPFLLTTLEQRLELLEAFGVDAAIVLPLDDQLAHLSPEQFVTEFLDARIGAVGVVTGENFTFGYARAGHVDTLDQLTRARGMWADAAPMVRVNGAVASSSRVRDRLQAGDMAEASALLSRPYTIEGVVQHGDKLGRTIGYPTANLLLGDYLRPLYGIYACRGRLADGRVLDGVANMGIRPICNPPKELLEPFFFDFEGDLYGQQIAVELIERLRPEAWFESLDEMVTQMDKDSARARAVLAAHPQA